jgi:hypothetical protein
MSDELIFDIKATKEFRDSFDWYKDQQKGLANKFEQSVYKRLEEIQEDPERYPKKEIHIEGSENSHS